MIGPCFLISGFLIFLSGVPSLFMSNKKNTGQWMATILIVAGSSLGLYAAFGILRNGSELVWSLPWTIPGGPLLLTVDALSVAFMIPILFLSALNSIYGLSYWKQSENPENGRKMRFFYGVLTAAMLAVTSARHGVFFLIAWEMMALSAYFLLITQDDDEKVREAGWIYLVATHFSTLMLFAFFALYGIAHGSLILERIHEGAFASSTANVLFLLALVGFGVKAGLLPIHGWLPPAHANAPSHVSAFFSGVLIKMGVYGVMRVCWMFSAPPVWWGILLLVLGITSGLFGVIYAIGQHDIKRLLAYHSIENIGIIFLGIGLGMIGIHFQLYSLTALGFAGAILHVWNHGLFKSLLFLSAGSVIHSAHTREIERLGGLAKRMPITSKAFLVGAAAICGLPPLNGFISELAIYLGLFHSLKMIAIPSLGIVILAIASLALIGGLAGACFIKVYGIVFLGEPRTPASQQAAESNLLMTAPMMVLAFLCGFIGLFPHFVIPLLDSIVSVWGDIPISLTQQIPLMEVTSLGLFLYVSILMGYIYLRKVQHRFAREVIGTWDCGYISPNARMQYTASSFAQIIVDFFGWILWPDKKAPVIRDLFPSSHAFHCLVPDVILDRGILSFFRTLSNWIEWLKVFQSGKLQVYLFYIFLTVFVLLMMI